MAEYDSIRELITGAVDESQAADLSMLQGQLDRYNSAAAAMGAPTMTMEEWIAAGKPASP